MSKDIKAFCQPDSKGFFGAYGGQYVPDAIKARLDELDQAFKEALADPEFTREMQRLLLHFAGRPSPVFHCRNLSKKLGGAQIWLKREDLNHLGAHKVNNTIGQCLLAKRMGKTRVIAETGAGHGTDRALVGGLLGMKPDDERLPFAFDEAKKAGLTYTIDEIELRDAHPNTAVIEAWSADGKDLVMQASSLGGGRIMVNKLDGIDVNFTGMYNTLVIRNEDASGTVAAVTSILSQLRVNVANMSLYRHKRGGDALMVIETDQHLKPHQVAFLSELPGILSITYYDKEEDEDVSGFDEGDL